MPTVNVLGVNVANLTRDGLHAEIARTVESGGHELFLNVNVHALNLAYSQPDLRRFFNSAYLTFCDGAGVVLGARLLGQRLPERITYADWMWQLAGFCVDRDYSLYFLGARPGVAAQAADQLLDRYGSLRFVGCHHGYFDKSLSSAENRQVIESINAVRPDILITAFGMPLQERWLMANWENLDARVFLTGGAVFDYISGNLRRGPRWLVDNHFEWLARLAIEPRRLWKRYVIGNPLFLFRVTKQRLARLDVVSHDSQPATMVR